MVSKLVKIVLIVAAVAAVVALVTTLAIVLPVDDEETTTSTTTTTTTSTTEATVTEPEPEIPDFAGMPYRVGVGIADMTGPPVEITFMGYAETSQRGQGIHTRQFARSFIFHRNDTRIVYVVTDMLAVGIGVRREVVKNLQERYGDTYSLQNVIIAGTHTHSGPGGHLVEFILDISILGFSRETYQAYVDGITRSIIRAHDNMEPSNLFYSEVDVNGVQRNRSPQSYLNNPPEERSRYPLNTDERLSQLRIEKADGSLHGVLNWFAVHATSMNNTNTLISSDNLGYSSLYLEKYLNEDLPVGKPVVVAAFAPSNMGDASPNTQDSRCEFSGNYCDNQELLCDLLERCFSSGPGENMFHSTQIIGTAVAEGAIVALSQPGQPLTGDLAVVHQFVEMPEAVVRRYDPISRQFVDTLVSGCTSALGYSFASGTTDGANTLNITQGTIHGNDLIDDIAAIIMEPTPEDIACHAPKPILLATGRANFPFPWHPRVVSISLMNLGGLFVAGVPGEPSTMAGRRIRDVITSALESQGYDDAKVVVSGLVNEYIHYVSTFEEYQIQRYEGASTIFGPNTLDIFLNKFYEFTYVAVEGGVVEAGEEPLDNRNSTLSLITPVLMDASPVGREFGDCILQPPLTVQPGDVVVSTFIAANPRNDLRQEDTYFVIERQATPNPEWTRVASDADWETKFIWDRIHTLFGTSRVTIEWEVPMDVVLGLHRIRYFGASRTILGEIRQFVGETDGFLVNAPAPPLP